MRGEGRTVHFECGHPTHTHQSPDLPKSLTSVRPSAQRPYSRRWSNSFWYFSITATKGSCSIGSWALRRAAGAAETALLPAAGPTTCVVTASFGVCSSAAGITAVSGPNSTPAEVISGA